MTALAILAGAGCSTAPATRSVSDVEPVAPAGETADVGESAAADPAGGVATPSRPRNAAVVSLEDAARQQRQAGDLERAAASLERALRIDPADAGLWLSLAEVRLDQGRMEQAAGLARRAETLADPASQTASRARALAARAAGR